MESLAVNAVCSQMDLDGTLDGRFISNTLQEADAHHFRIHQRQPAETFMHTAP
jgi:hypothetical protein